MPISLALAVILLTLTALGCGKTNENAESETKTLRIAITTSTRDSGLMDVLVPSFEKEFNVQVKLIAVGTGKALRLGRMGEADVILVHAIEAELEFLKNGYATRREWVMYNYFEILGPDSDPAKVKGSPPETAMQKIHQANSLFVSRGDDSGTNKKELQLWEMADRKPDHEHYVETGQGMGASLMVANEKQGYILCDQGTYLAMRNKVSLVPLAQKTDSMKNHYGVLCINSKNHPAVNEKHANQFADFLISPKAQSMIREFTINDSPLFYPAIDAGASF